MNKKLLLSIGIISIIPTSISTIISCAGNHDKKILPQEESLPKQVAQDVAVAKKSIATISGITLKVNDIITAVSTQKILDTQALKKLGIAENFPTIPNGITLKYTHDALTKDGDLTVNVHISKGDINDTATFDIIVTGINHSESAIPSIEETAKSFEDFLSITGN